MTTIDLGVDPSAATPPPPELLDGLPRRVTLTLTELRYCAASAGDAPLPFETAEPKPAVDPLAARLGGVAASAADSAYDDALATLREPMESLTRRGLITPEGIEPGVLGALGLLASPGLGVDLDVVIDDVQARAWHRFRDGVTATLATVDGLVFELAWFGVEDWPAELRRVPALGEDVAMSSSGVPARVDLPLELLDAVGEAIRSHRLDLIDTVVGQHDDPGRDGSGEPLDAATVRSIADAFHSECRGRIRAVLTDVARAQPLFGVVSWVLLADGWHALLPHRAPGATDESAQLRVEIRRVDPEDFAQALAPVLAEVTA